MLWALVPIVVFGLLWLESRTESGQRRTEIFRQMQIDEELRRHRDTMAALKGNT